MDMYNKGRDYVYTNLMRPMRNTIMNLLARSGPHWGGGSIYIIPSSLTTFRFSLQQQPRKP